MCDIIFLLLCGQNEFFVQGDKMANTEQDRTIQVCLNLIFTLGVVAVIIYVVFGSLFAVYAGLGIYAFSFSVASLLSIRKLFLVASYKDRLKLYEAKANLTETERINYNEKKQEVLKVVNKTRNKELAKAIAFGIFAIFAVVVLVLF